MGKHRGRLGVAVFLLAGSAAIAGFALGDRASMAYDRSPSMDGSTARMLGEGACEVSWPVFDTSVVQFLESQLPFECQPFSGGGWRALDLDGDAISEMLFVRQDFVPTMYVIRRAGGVAREDLVLAWADLQAPWVPAGGNPAISFIDLTDLTGDGLPDVVVRVQWTEAGSQRTAFGYLRNLLQPASASAADINRDGVVNGADLTLLLVAWAQGS